MNSQEAMPVFFESQLGAGALGALETRGLSIDDAHHTLALALDAVKDHVNDYAESIGALGQHPGRSFFSVFAAGIFTGNGVRGAFSEGSEGVIHTRVADSVAKYTSRNPDTAAAVATAVLPYVIDFVKQYLGI